METASGVGGNRTHVHQVSTVDLFTA